MTSLGMDTRLYLEVGPVDFMTGLPLGWFIASHRPSRDGLDVHDQRIRSH